MNKIENSRIEEPTGGVTGIQVTPENLESNSVSSSKLESEGAGGR